MPSEKRRTDAAGSGSVPLDDIEAATLDAPEISETLRSAQGQSPDFRFHIESCPLWKRECFELWRLNLVRRYRQLQNRKRKGFMPDYAEQLEALRAEWRLFVECYRLAAGWKAAA